ncbi:hypothetical protein ACWDTT_10490 [Streptosporangium sandarakinum]
MQHRRPTTRLATAGFWAALAGIVAVFIAVCALLAYLIGTHIAV